MSAASCSLGLHASLYHASFGNTSPYLHSPSHPMSNSAFFRVLTASHRNSSVTKKIDSTSETKRGTSNNDLLQRFGVSSTPRSVAPDPSSTSSFAQPIYSPSGAWAWLDGLSIRDCRDKISLNSQSLYSCDCKKTILKLLKMVATSKLTSEQVELLAGRSNIYPSRKSFSKISRFLLG